MKKDFIVRLKQAGQSAKMVREVCEEELKNCGSDPEKLAEMIRCLGWVSVDDGFPEYELPAEEEDEIICVIEQVIDEICRYAKTLSPKDYHRFYELISRNGWMYYFGIM